MKARTWVRTGLLFAAVLLGAALGGWLYAISHSVDMIALPFYLLIGSYGGFGVWLVFVTKGGGGQRDQQLVAALERAAKAEAEVARLRARLEATGQKID